MVLNSAAPFSACSTLSSLLKMRLAPVVVRVVAHFAGPAFAMYRLLYADGRGAAEVVRMAFALAGKSADLEDVRYPIDISKYPTGGLDAACPTFVEERAKGKHVANLNRLQILEVIEGGVTTSIGETPAIERFVGKRMGLMGSNDIEYALIDAICEHLRDIRQEYMNAKKEDKFKPVESGPTAVDTFFSEKLKVWMGKLENCFGNGGFAVGSSVSIADLRMHHFVKEFFDNKEAVAAAITSSPKITASVAAVEADANIAKYIAERKPTPF